jgi:hypothetical protein
MAVPEEHCETISQYFRNKLEKIKQSIQDRLNLLPTFNFSSDASLPKSLSEFPKVTPEEVTKLFTT